MTILHASLRLRPTRIGFLVRPTDLRAIRRIMRLCVCLWGGLYNPILPVCRALPGQWRRSADERLTGRQLTDGYLKFFEPDVFVEAAPGLAAACGISDDGFGSDRRVLPLDDVAQLEENGGGQFRFGLCIFDLYVSFVEGGFQFV